MFLIMSCIGVIVLLGIGYMIYMINKLIKKIKEIEEIQIHILENIINNKNKGNVVHMVNTQHREAYPHHFGYSKGMYGT